MVVEAHAVAHPRTVVVHPKNAFLTNAAVMSPRRFDHGTLLTIFELASCPDRIGVVILYIIPHELLLAFLIG